MASASTNLASLSAQRRTQTSEKDAAVSMRNRCTSRFIEKAAPVDQLVNQSIKKLHVHRQAHVLMGRKAGKPKYKRASTSKSLIKQGPTGPKRSKSTFEAREKVVCNGGTEKNGDIEEILYFHDDDGYDPFADGLEITGEDVSPLDFPEVEDIPPEADVEKITEIHAKYSALFGDVSDSDSDSDTEEKLSSGVRKSLIMVHIEERLKKHAQFIESNRESKAQLVQPGFPLTVAEFSLQLQGAFCAANLEASFQNNILGVLRDALPNIAFPSRTSKKGNNISDLAKFVPPSRQLIEFGACPNDCCVYTDSTSTRCSTCKSSRYMSANSNVNAKSLFYRSITATIIELLHYPFFLKLLAYKYVRPSGKSKYHYMDIIDGENAKKHLANMRSQYQKKFAAEQNKPTEINILISLFYDGIQLFRKKQENYWPLFFTILNLPPAIRTKVGSGMFLLTAFYGEMDSATENFIFDECLVKELQALRKGIPLFVDGINYFIQV